jgi:hypothetical protein
MIDNSWSIRDLLDPGVRKPSGGNTRAFACLEPDTGMSNRPNDVRRAGTELNHTYVISGDLRLR